jgi:hypothetical protein
MPNTHDILTGSRPDGTAFTDGMDHTCNNYMSNTDGMGQVQLGHSDKQGGGNSSWNSATAAAAAASRTSSRPAARACFTASQSIKSGSRVGRVWLVGS